MGLREIAFLIVCIIVIGIDLLIATNDIRQSIKDAEEILKKNEEESEEVWQEWEIH